MPLRPGAQTARSESERASRAASAAVLVGADAPRAGAARGVSRRGRRSSRGRYGASACGAFGERWPRPLADDAAQALFTAAFCLVDRMSTAVPFAAACLAVRLPQGLA